MTFLQVNNLNIYIYGQFLYNKLYNDFYVYNNNILGYKSKKNV